MSTKSTLLSGLAVVALALVVLAVVRSKERKPEYYECLFI
jgi:hypothetical protein